jgi:hypothetical protein
MATECGRSNCSATGWFGSGYILRHEASELFGVESDIHLVLLYREYVAIGQPLGLYMQDILDRTPRAERLKIKRHYVGDELYQSAKGADHSILDQMDATLLQGGMRRVERAPASHERGSTARAMLQIAGDVRDGKVPILTNWPRCS